MHTHITYCVLLPDFISHNFFKAVTEKDMLDAVQKVIKGYAKFSATPKYMAFQ